MIEIICHDNTERHYSGEPEGWMAEDRFSRGLKNRRQITISIIGRRTGQTITLPVWFVSQQDTLWLLPVHGSETQWYRNLLVNPTITIKVEKERRTFHARILKGTTSVRQVIEQFRDKYTSETITRLYPGPLNAAVKVKVQ
jgi:deazaflavin-dependent oxidoreductase (nitroreductase family)